MSDHPRLAMLKETAAGIVRLLDQGEVGLATWHASLFRLVTRLALQADVAETIRAAALDEAAKLAVEHAEKHIQPSIAAAMRAFAGDIRALKARQ